MKNPFIRIAIVGISLFMCIGLLRSIVENLQRTDLVSERQTALQKEEQRNKNLQDKLREATSASFIEREARNKLGLVREGDTVVLVGPPGQAQDAHAFSESGDHNLSRWQKWWKLFF